MPRTEQFDPSLVPSPRSRWLVNSWTVAFLLLALAFVLMFAGMSLLKKQQFVERLRLQGAKVTLEPVGPELLIEWGGPRYTDYLNRITAIDARAATLTRADIAYIATLQHLRRLDLSHTLLTDDDLDVLGRLPALETLNLRGTRVTELGVENLRAAHPRLTVER